MLNNNQNKGGLFGNNQTTGTVGGSIFGNNNNQNTTGQIGGGMFQNQNQGTTNLFGNNNNQTQGANPVQGGAGGGLFANNNNQAQPAQQGGIFGNNNQTQGANQGGIFANQNQNQGIMQNNNAQQQQQQQQQQLLNQQATVHSQAWKEMKDVYQRLSIVKKEQISVERDINVSDNNNKYAHKPINTLPDQSKQALKQVNEMILNQEKEIAKIIENQKELFNQIQETRKTIQQSSLSLKQTAQQVKDIQETVNELITEQQDQKQYITNFFYTFTNYLENRQFPRIVLPQPFIIKAQERFQLKLEKLQRQINEVEQMLQVEIVKRNDEEELAYIFVIIEQLFKYFNNVTSLVYEFHKHYESFRMKIVHYQDQREYGFANDLNESTKQSLNEENRYFKQLSIISENLEKQIRKHEEDQQVKHLHDKRIVSNQN